MEEENRPEFESYMNEQLEILKGHMERIMLRIFNKYTELEMKEKEKSLKI